MINGISNYTNTATNMTDLIAKNTEKKTTEKKEDIGAIYEASTASKTYSYDANKVQQMWDEANKKTAEFKDMVSKLITQQGDALINAEDMWRRLRTGDITVDEETVNAAKEAVSENGYYGVEQTSDRIVEFAKAISGGDSESVETLKKAFEKGFKEATKAWGDELPEISQKTYDKVMEKLDKWAEESETAITKGVAADNLEDITFGTV